MKNIKVFTIFIATVIITSLLLAISCHKDKHDCYDAILYRQHKDDFCTADCPGVTGCDGKFYCNECVANQQGISVR